MKTTRVTRALLVPAFVLGAVGFGLTGCSKANSELACESAEELGDGVADIADEVGENDLRDAQSDAKELRRDFDRLSGRVEKLSETERTAIEPLLQPADDAIAGLEAATTIEDMGAALDSGRASIEALATGVDSALRC